jgi:hypothetical protein
MAKRKKTSWSLERWQSRCAWCARRIPDDHEAFGIGVRLRPEAFQEFDPGTVQPLLLHSAGKTVAMMIVTDDSPAKRDGKDAMFQLCSEDCAARLQLALQQELGPDGDA